MKIFGIVAGVLFLLLGFGGCSSYNSIVTKQESVDEAWANVETAYQRRFDLIPNLVETVKGYADFEKSTLIGVTEARAAAMGAMRAAGENGKLGEFQAANNNLGVAMGRFFGYTENYPDLKANRNFLELQAQLEGTENRISTARTRYNKTVKEFNSKIKRFPGMLFAGMAGAEEREYFEAAEGTDAAPSVNFSE
ncbi:MAG: LemA family protein [Flavobacteriales bacterium]|nr:LemA family protein [Flavobacteriales bacterium]